MSQYHSSHDYDRPRPLLACVCLWQPRRLLLARIFPAPAKSCPILRMLFARRPWTDSLSIRSQSYCLLALSFHKLDCARGSSWYFERFRIKHTNLHCFICVCKATFSENFFQQFLSVECFVNLLRNRIGDLILH